MLPPRKRPPPPPVKDPVGAALPAAFAPGEFACPLKFTVAFALNHRLKPANVVHALSSSVLDPFAINNRSHCYVYRDRLGHVCRAPQPRRAMCQTRGALWHAARRG